MADEASQASDRPEAELAQRSKVPLSLSYCSTTLRSLRDFTPDSVSLRPTARKSASILSPRPRTATPIWRRRGPKSGARALTLPIIPPREANSLRMSPKALEISPGIFFVRLADSFTASASPLKLALEFLVKRVTALLAASVRLLTFVKNSAKVLAWFQSCCRLRKGLEPSFHILDRVVKYWS